MNARIVVLPGDGIGPEVTAEGVRALEVVAQKFGHRFAFDSRAFGGASIDRNGVPLTDETLGACSSASAILLGAVGGPRWDTVEASERPEQGLLKLRKQLGLFANLRPIRPYRALFDRAPVKAPLLQGVDIMVVRELTGGLYFGQPRFTKQEGKVLRAVDTLEYTDAEIRRVSELAFRLAGARRRKVTVVDKANVLESSRLWRKVTGEVGRAFPDITLEYMLVDSASMRLISGPSVFDVLLTENMFGDILTDEASVLCGSLGMVPSASIGSSGPGLYEPIHGSAPDIAGKGIADPIGSILSVALLLRHSLGLDAEAAAVEAAVQRVVESQCWTPDLGGKASTGEVGARVAEYIGQ
jgi:3-isopropylmalate dehydrogenase